MFKIQYINYVQGMILIPHEIYACEIVFNGALRIVVIKLNEELLILY